MKETRPVLTDDRRSFDRQQYPSMDYTGLYKALGKIVNVVPVVEIGVEGTRNLKKSHLGWKYKSFSTLVVCSDKQILWKTVKF